MKRWFLLPLLVLLMVGPAMAATTQLTKVISTSTELTVISDGTDSTWFYSDSLNVVLTPALYIGDIAGSMGIYYHAIASVGHPHIKIDYLESYDNTASNFVVPEGAVTVAENDSTETAHITWVRIVVGMKYLKVRFTGLATNSKRARVECAIGKFGGVEPASLTGAGTIDVVKLGGNAINLGSGVVGSGTLRTTLALTEVTATQIIRTIGSTTVPESLYAAGTTFKSATLVGRKAARTANVSTAYLGLAATNDSQPWPIRPDEVVYIEAVPGQKFDLEDFYLDVGTNGDGVIIWYQ